MFERILVPLDGSSRAEAVLDQLAPILEGKNPELILLRVESPSRHLGGTEFLPVTANYLDEAKRYLAPLRARLKSQGVRVRTLIREGPIAETILGETDRADVRLIAMATHGRTGLARWVMGSVAEKVVREANVPVLVFRSFPPTDPRGAFDPILIPVSNSQGRILPYLREFADLFGSTSIVLRIETPGEGVQVRDESAIVTQDLLRAGLPAELRERRGDAVREILDEAREDGAGLIALSTRDARTTERVLRRTPAPLLVIR